MTLADEANGVMREAAAEIERLRATNADLLTQTQRDAARFNWIRGFLHSDRAGGAAARASFANDVWHMECEARAAIAKAEATTHDD